MLLYRVKAVEADIWTTEYVEAATPTEAIRQFLLNYKYREEDVMSLKCVGGSVIREGA